MNPSEHIRKRRVVLGLADTEVAKRAGLSIYEYADIEQHADELATALSLKDARHLCEILGLDLLLVLGVPTEDVEKMVHLQKRNELIKCKRLELDFTVRDLAEHIGFDEQTVVNLESNPEHIDTLPAEIAMQIADQLKLPASFLLLSK